MSKHTDWEAWDDADGTKHFNVTLSRVDAMRWDRERLEMLQDAEFLIKAAFRGETEGPLTLPKTGLRVRS